MRSSPRNLRHGLWNPTPRSPDFLFFDVADLESPLRGANIDITGVADAKGNELMFFEIPLDQYLNAPKNP